MKLFFIYKGFIDFNDIFFRTCQKILLFQIFNETETNFLAPMGQMMMGGQHGVIQGQPGMIGSQPVMMPGQPGMMQPQTMGMMGQMGMPNMGMQVGPMGMGVQPMGMQTQMGGMVQMGGMGQVMTHPMGHMAPGKIFKVFMMGFKKV